MFVYYPGWWHWCMGWQHNLFSAHFSTFQAERPTKVLPITLFIQLYRAYLLLWPDLIYGSEERSDFFKWRHLLGPCLLGAPPSPGTQILQLSSEHPHRPSGQTLHPSLWMKQSAEHAAHSGRDAIRLDHLNLPSREATGGKWHGAGKQLQLPSQWASPRSSGDTSHAGLAAQGAKWRLVFEEGFA